MARLTADQRRNLPAGSFAGPNRSFPVNDRVHAEKALQLEPRAEKAGSVTPAEGARIKARARNVLRRKRLGL